METSCGDAAATTWIFRGPRWDARNVARAGYSAETGRGHGAAETTVPARASSKGGRRRRCGAHGETPLHVAARNGQLKAIRCLATELGADVRAKDRWGRAAAHFAAWEGHVAVLRDLKLLASLGNESDGDEVFLVRDHDGRLPVDEPSGNLARCFATYVKRAGAFGRPRSIRVAPRGVAAISPREDRGPTPPAS